MKENYYALYLSIVKGYSVKKAFDEIQLKKNTKNKVPVQTKSVQLAFDI